MLAEEGIRGRGSSYTVYRIPNASCFAQFAFSGFQFPARVSRSDENPSLVHPEQDQPFDNNDCNLLGKDS